MHLECTERQGTSINNSCQWLAHNTAKWCYSICPEAGVRIRAIGTWPGPENGENTRRLGKTSKCWRKKISSRLILGHSCHADLVLEWYLFQCFANARWILMDFAKTCIRTKKCSYFCSIFWSFIRLWAKIRHGNSSQCTKLNPMQIVIWTDFFPSNWLDFSWEAQNPIFSQQDAGILTFRSAVSILTLNKFTSSTANPQPQPGELKKIGLSETLNPKP